MPGKGDPWGDKKRRARHIQRKVLPKTEAEDQKTTAGWLGAVQAGSGEEQARLLRRHKGMGQLSRFKKTADGYESTYTGIMLSSTQEFATFSEFFRDADLKLTDIKCKISTPFTGCKTLQEVRDKMAGEGRFTGNPVVLKARGKHQYDWMVQLSEDQFKQLNDYYMGKDQGRSP